MMILKLLRTICGYIDMVVCSLMVLIYNLLNTIANTTLAKDYVDPLTKNIYALLGVLMLFKIAFSLLSYIVNPDEMANKDKGLGGIVKNIVIAVVLTLFVPFIFDKAMGLQQAILKEDIIGRIVTGYTTTSGSLQKKSAGEKFTFDVISGFVQPFDKKSDSIPQQYNDLTNSSSDSYMSTNVLLSDTIINATDSNNNFVFDYKLLVSTIACGFICYLLLLFCFDTAMRTVKLIFLQVIAPIPIASYVDPRGQKGLFNKWVKSCFSTYISLFIRLAAIYFALFLITKVVLANKLVTSDGVTIQQPDFFVQLFLVFGALLFAKSLPKLLEDLTGLKADGDFTLNPMKRLGGVPLAAAAIGGIGGGLGAASANLINGIKENRGFRRTFGSTIAGLNSGAARGMSAGFGGKGKDNPFKTIGLGLKGSNDARNLRTRRNLNGDSGFRGVLRRAGVGVQNKFGIQSGATKYDKQVSAINNFLKDQKSLGDYASGEVAKGKGRSNTKFSWVNTRGETIQSSGNVNVLKNNIDVLKANGNAATEIADAEYAYAAAAKQANIDYITDNLNTDSNISAGIFKLNTDINDNKNFDGFSTMGSIENGSDWNDSKGTMYNKLNEITSSEDYAKSQANKVNDKK